uniref:Uncharacterized protein n=1 Tax=Strongyloides stercoralis TaxID=6248 RepID=A0A0K0E5P0_STRER
LTVKLLETYCSLIP